jgi:hypothetical protein
MALCLLGTGSAIILSLIGVHSHRFCFCSWFDRLSVLVAKLIGSEFGFVEFVAGGNQMKGDRGEFVGGCGDGFGEPIWLATVEVAKDPD